MNAYFLVIALLQLVAEITPVNPLTTWLPLAVLFTVTAVKEGIDDVRRWRADRQANLRPCIVVRGGRRVEVAAQEIAVGDVVWLRDGEEMPCDVVMLASSEARGTCLVQARRARAALSGVVVVGCDAPHLAPPPAPPADNQP